MNASFRPDSEADDPRLHWLAQQGAEGLLDGREARELSEWLARSESARHIFAGYCQLLVALECEPCLEEAMLEPDWPENVVPLPGVAAGRRETPAAAAAAWRGRTGRGSWRRMAGVAAIAVLTGLLIGGATGWPFRSDRVGSERQPSSIVAAGLMASGMPGAFPKGPDEPGSPITLASLGDEARPLLASQCVQCHRF